VTGARIVLAKPGLDGHDRGLKPIAEQLLTAMRAAGVHAPLAVGGTIPPRDAAALRRLGVAGVFAVGTPLPGVVEGVLMLASAEVAAR
jgi:methylmalonyl-CoA mutase cobalamin-binding domain/chain